MSMKTDLELLQGRWRQVHYERDGVTSPGDGEQGWQPVTEIRGQTFTVTIADGSVVLEGAFKLFAEQLPKAIDWLDESGSYASDHPILAIYELTEHSFAFCAAYDGAARPTAFKTEQGQVLRRMERAG
jgi:uncharacterized protein (TIGR03067 family)